MSEVAADKRSEVNAEETAHVAPVLLVGEQLKAAREQAGMTALELARLLRLGVQQIEALEQGNWASLPGRTFVKGFVRNYARAVRLDPVPLLAELDKLPGLTNPSLDPPASIHAPMPDQTQAPRRDMLVVLAGVALVVLAVAAYFFLPASLLNSEEEEPPSVLATESVDEGMEEEEVLAEASQTEPIQQAQQEVGGMVAPVEAVPVQPLSPPAAGIPAVAPVTATTTSIPTNAPVNGTATATRTETLSFKFDKDSWVEIKDGTGNQIVSRQYPAGTVKEVSGVPPFVMTVGNASHAKLKYKGKEVALEPRSVSDVARMTLE